MALSGSCSTGSWVGETTSGKLVFNWTATQNKSNNTSTISWNIKASITYGWITYSELRVKINGTQVYYRSRDNHTNCSNGTQLASGTKTLTHNANGACSFSVEIGAGIYYSGINETGSGNFTLNPHTVYTLAVSAGAGSTISVNRTSSGYASTGTITNGAKLYYGDKISVTYSASSGYGLSTHTLNGSSFSSGGTHTVSGNVSVASTALAAYTLSISAGTGSSISVNRTSSGVTGTGVLNNGATIYKNDTLVISFAANNNYEVLTHTVNGVSFTSGNTHTVSGNVSVVSTARVLSSSVGATNADIESVSSITVTKYNDSYYHSLYFSFGSLSGYINSDGSISPSEVKISQPSIPFTIPSTFYGEIPNSKTGICTITCKTYTSSSSSTQIGNSTTCTFTISTNEELCSPTVEGAIADTDDVTLALTDDETVLVRYKSDAICYIRSNARNSATIVSRSVNGVTPIESSGTYYIIENNVQNTSFVFSATDSRGYTKSVTVRPTMINYVLLTCNPTIVRENPTSDLLNVYVNGNFFRGSFGYVTNTLEIAYQYKETGSTTWSNWAQVSAPITYGSSTYSTSFTIDLHDETAYQKAYDIRLSVRDGRVTIGNTDQYLTVLWKSLSIPRGIPIFDWGQSDFNINVDTEINGNMDVAGTLTVDGQTDIDNNLSVTGDLDISGNINIANDIQKNGSSIIIKHKMISLSGVQITTQSASGSYYATGYDPSNYGIDGEIIGLMLCKWTGAPASFVPYYQEGKIRFFSDVSQTITSIDISVTYI